MYNVQQKRRLHCVLATSGAEEIELAPLQVLDCVLHHAPKVTHQTNINKQKISNSILSI
jgi:hypothetical protein